MKTFRDLTADQRTKAIQKCTTELLEAICEGAIRFNDELDRDDLQKRIDKAWDKMNRLHTPWFIGEAIMETCGEDLEGMARSDAEDALYSEPAERVIRGII